MKVKLCCIDEFDDEEVLQVTPEGMEPLAVYQVEDQYFVTDDTCSHGKASLSEEGELDGFVITCTWHDGQFDVRTGEVLAMPCTKPIRSYPVTREGDEIWIEVDA